MEVGKAATPKEGYRVGAKDILRLSWEPELGVRCHDVE